MTPTPTPPPTTPTQPGTVAAIHASSITGVLTLFLLLIMNATVFKGGTAPADAAYLLSPVVSYGVSLVAGFTTRWRLRHRHTPVPAPAAQGPDAQTAPPA